MTTLTIPGYEILELIGEGGLAKVYKARQLSLDRLVAIKVLPDHFADDPGCVDRFQREARIVATLKDPHIVQVYEAGHQDRTYYVVMEFIAGYNVATWLERKGRIEEEEALLVATYVAEALDYAWQKANIIHGDIKPANILVDDDGTIKLADFLDFSARDAAGGSAGEVIVGTPNYMAPERLRGGPPLDFKMDVYSLGAVLYHMTTGRLPFMEISDAHEVMMHHLNHHIPDPTEFAPNLSPATRLLIEKLLVKDPEQRYGQWLDVRKDIERALHGKPPMHPAAPGLSTVAAARPQPPATGEVEPRARPAGPLAAIPTTLITPENSSRHFAVTEKWFALVAGLIVLLGVYEFLLADRPHRQVQTILAKGIALAVRQATVAALPTVADLPRTVEPAPVVIAVPTAAGAGPTPAPAAPQVTPGAPRPSPEEFAACATLMRSMLAAVRERRYAAAAQLLDQWQARQPGQSFYAAALAAQRDRLLKIRELYAHLEQNKTALLGRPVTIPPAVSGTLVDIAGGKAIVERTVGGASARYESALSALDAATLDEWVRAAATPDDLAIWELAGLRFAEAGKAAAQATTPQRAAELRAWQADWQGWMANLQALAELDNIRALSSQGQFQNAEAVLALAKSRFGDTDVFRWAHQREIQELGDTIATGLLQSKSFAFDSQAPIMFPTAAPGREDEPIVFPTPAAADRHSESSAEHNPPRDIRRPISEFGNDRADPLDVFVVPDEVGPIDEMVVTDLIEQLFDYDSKVVKVKFTGRGPIRQVDETTFKVELMDRDNSVTAIFPEEGRDWMRKVNEGAGGPVKSIFAIVGASDHEVRLIGREPPRPGVQSVEYGW